MSLQAVVIAVLSGGLVGALVKSLADRTQRFREQMLDAGGGFLGTVHEMVMGADDSMREVVRYREARRNLEERFQTLRTSWGDDGIPPDVAEIVRRIDELGVGPTPVLSPGNWGAARFEESINSIHDAIEEIADGRSEAKALLTAVERVYGQALRVREAGGPLRHARWGVAERRARLGMLFDGRWGGDSVLNSADRLIARLDVMRDACVDAVSGDLDEVVARFDDSRDGLESEAGVFGKAVSQAVRRAWL